MIDYVVSYYGPYISYNPVCIMTRHCCMTPFGYLGNISSGCTTPPILCQTERGLPSDRAVTDEYVLPN